jgi:CRP-like cAMP-binding protein
MPQKSELAPDISSATTEFFEKLSPHVTFQRIPPKTKLWLNENGIHYGYLIRKGLFMVHHNADEVILSSLPIPSIIGVGGIISQDSLIFIQSQTESEVAILTAPEVQQLIEQLDLWELLAKHVLKMTNRLFVTSSLLSAPNAYEILRHQLLELIKEPPEIRETMTAAYYIQKKTRLSRSAIMKFLAQLKKGGYVTLENGILKEINRLPLKY